MKDSERTMDLTARVCHHISEIPQEEWDELVNHRLLHTYKWMELLEYSLREGISPYYITVTRDNQLVGGTVCFPSYRIFFGTYVPSIACLCPFSDEIGIYVKQGEPIEPILLLLYRTMEDVARQEKARIIVITNVKEDEYVNFFRKKTSLMQVLPSTHLNIQWKTFKDYLRSLPRKSKKNIRHTLNQGERRGLQLNHSHDFSDAEFLFHFYKENLLEHGHGYPLSFTSDFYKGLEKYVSEYAYILRCYHEDRLLGYWVYFFDGKTACMAISGSEKNYAKEYNAYFNICYDAVREMIEKGCSRIFFGPTTYTVKRRIGCTLEEKKVAIKFLNPALDVAFRLLIPLWNLQVRRTYATDSATEEKEK
ncbi:MAG: GNAT family N-acetyltransferase [Theionarchaea archaeon]|nr:GNAT family N-acetyltransferase [Theionarchaea archaeon]MBU7000547.1 GNAT family N-acetyltransferase [Theionarchaea archaeon]MBU7021590.1 GNAT family N-acetyltransferase [Theionarchaea archaeon]MBU7036214.1 GNAT family N-acetyltransferase [Theionarchaea archaeon]MBU7041715.1 GNAT family N-acetyltransferase [Theionarchaea archaeon]